MTLPPPLPPHLSIAWRWVMLLNVDKRLSNLVQRYDATAQHAVGYPHIDHEAGLSMHIYAFCRGEADSGFEITTNLFETHQMVTLRCDLLLDAPIEVLRPEQIAAFNLPEVPPGINFYEMRELEPMRALELLHPFRAPGYPDDIQFLLIKKSNQNEQIWGRIERDLADQQYEVILLNKPYQDFGVQQGSRRMVQLVPVEGHPHISHIPVATL